MPDGDELALVDAVAVDDPWVGSLELFEPDTMRVAVLTRADPAAIGFSAVAGLLSPCTPEDEHGVLVRFASPTLAARLHVQAPTAPGHLAEIGVAECRRLGLGEPVEVDGPLVLAFDGERKRRLREGDRAVITVRRDGPRVLDIDRAMRAAARLGLFVRESEARLAQGSGP
jgi:hypothetical protein